ncbi:MAG: amidohydrolase family protein, partial [Candidatus Korarchaeota archaeon]|nr:amidohydrolase family protein [Candidatus Korarchaeota archaeon]NIU85181.1 amidohydrolase family protein [Candidatus Thorarchaeota archaeon]NIW15270.1 amidohydrolase family protein [Candidatus Thorarchaeota archaeon]NIW53242.1 amidohydrolase family protein [Candidatus Korarchaeota archaeon]
IKPELKEGDEKINAKGLIVSPGVIDVHSHSDLSILKHNKGKSRLMQGITTDATGNCGISPHTFAKEYGQVLEDQLHNSEGINEKDHVDWRTLGEWREKVDKRGIGLNIAPFCGFGTVRASVMGKEGEGGERSKPTDEELEKMKKLVEEAMNDGAFGMSTGLEYATQRNAFKEEIVELLRVVRRYGGSYMSHIRSEDDFLIEAVKEFIMICDQAGVRGTISHHKAASPWNWGKPVETLRLIEEAREQGINIICDAYPWTRVAVRDVGSFFLNEGESI